jgi:hypothetical protein
MENLAVYRVRLETPAPEPVPLPGINPPRDMAHEASAAPNEPVSSSVMK